MPPSIYDLLPPWMANAFGFPPPGKPKPPQEPDPLRLLPLMAPLPPNHLPDSPNSPWPNEWFRWTNDPKGNLIPPKGPPNKWPQLPLDLDPRPLPPPTISDMPASSSNNPYMNPAPIRPPLPPSNPSIIISPNGRNITYTYTDGTVVNMNFQGGVSTTTTVVPGKAPTTVVDPMATPYNPVRPGPGVETPIDPRGLPDYTALSPVADGPAIEGPIEIIPLWPKMPGIPWFMVLPGNTADSAPKPAPFVGGLIGGFLGGLPGALAGAFAGSFVPIGPAPNRPPLPIDSEVGRY